MRRVREPAFLGLVADSSLIWNAIQGTQTLFLGEKMCDIHCYNVPPLKKHHFEETLVMVLMVLMLWTP